MRQTQYQSGFTLIEILVVVAIIGMLSAVILTSLAGTRVKGRDARRKGDLTQLAKALELYYNTNNIYPTTGGAWQAVAGNCGGTFTLSGATGYIPNLAPTFLGQLPTDPKSSTAVCSGYNYRSDGVNYKIIDNAVSGLGGPETFPAVGQPFYDPARPTTGWMVASNAAATAAW